MTPEPRDVIAAAIRAAWDEYAAPNYIPGVSSVTFADAALAALRAAGYETYRPDTHRLMAIVPERYHPPAYPTLEPASDDTEGE